MDPWDVIVVGQGLAGTTLAWHLHDARQRVLLLDEEAPVTSSKIAAGLITPITGRRLAHSQRFDACLAAAQIFYAGVEARTGRTFFHARTAIRLFQSDDERAFWAQRRTALAVQAHLITPQPVPLIAPAIADASGGGFAMRSAQLDVAAFLAASRAYLPYAAMTLDWSRDVAVSDPLITVGGHATRRLISCEGYGAQRNPYFSQVPFKAATGDILTVRFHRPMPAHTMHRGIWVAPTAHPDEFKVGSTYDWANLDGVPRAEARAQIERKLQAFVHVPYTVLDHQAAVRPIIHESRPVLGLHRNHSRLGYFNGLGSKGALLAPWHAHHFTQFLVHSLPLPESADAALLC